MLKKYSSYSQLEAEAANENTDKDRLIELATINNDPGQTHQIEYD